MIEKRILLIANGCFSDKDANGRTLKQYFSGVDSESIAQFYVYGTPDFSVCQQYYQVSDKLALESFLTRKELFNIPLPAVSEISASKTSSKKRKKTPLAMLLRELIWKYSCWNGLKLNQWMQAFKPTHIVLFLANNQFTIDLATKIANEYSIPIIACSTEDYYFKDYNYFKRDGIQRPSLIYNLLRKNLKKAYQRCTPYITHGIFNTPMLAKLYEEEFGYPCTSILPKSNIDYIENYRLPIQAEIKVSYLGNLGLNRHLPLLEIADAIATLIPGGKLDVYGAIPTTVKQEFLSNPNICYHGFIGYESVVEVMHQSTLLVHAEHNTEANNRDIKFGFSTKIADSICCGTPFLVYGSREISGNDFVAEHGCAFVAESREELYSQLKLALTDECVRQEILVQANIVKTKFFQANNFYKYI